MLAQLPEASVDVLLTDPPYSSGGMFRGDREASPDSKYRGWSQNPDGTAAASPRLSTGHLVVTVATNGPSCCGCLRGRSALRATRPGGVAFMFSDWRQVPAATDALQMGGWTWRGLSVLGQRRRPTMKGRFRNHIEFVAWGPTGLSMVRGLPVGTHQRADGRPR